MSLPIEPYLIELLRRTNAEGVELIIAGGLGIYLKHRWVAEEVQAKRRENLIPLLPDARATSDIDAFLELEVLVRQPLRAQFVACLDELGFEPLHKYLHYERPTESPGLRIRLDLLGYPGEYPRDSNLKVAMKSQPKRMGPKDHKAKPPCLHAFPTEEAFAVHDKVQSLPLQGSTPDGVEFDGCVRVPHPFASLCMKIRAAEDYERAPLGKRPVRGAKHAQDVYLLVAMLSEDELDECSLLRQHYTKHAELMKTTEACSSLFSKRDSPGCLTIKSQFSDADIEVFSSVLTELFLAL